MKKYFFLVLPALSVLAGCSSSDEPVVNSDDKVNFSASINGSATSRAYDQTWEQDDEIGISCTTGGKVYTNVAYTTNGTGDFTVVTPGAEIYYQTANPVTFTAYYPYAADTNTITADTHNQTVQKTFDYLWSQAEGKKAAPNVVFAFNHKMAKLVLTVKKGLDVSFDEVRSAAYTLAGFKNKGSFNPTAGTAVATGEASVAWTFSDVTPKAYSETNEVAVYTFILFPQEFDTTLPLTAATSLQTFATALDFTAANAAIGDTDAKNEWVAGRQYNMSVTLHKTAITVDGCTITAWDEANGGNFDAE